MPTMYIDTVTHFKAIRALSSLGDIMTEEVGLQHITSQEDYNAWHS